MGGNALSIETIRLNKDEFESFSKEVVEKLLTKFSYASPLKYYKNKQDFGDLDIIMDLSERKSNIKEILIELFNTSEIYTNDNMYSIEYKKFQVDLIFKSKENIECAEFFFSYNDLNLFIGRVAHKFGLKFGHEGLHYPVREESGNLVNRIEISKDPEKIYQFLGYDYDQYLKGFDEVEDIFRFVTSSPYFNYKIFDYDQLNHANRTRNRKRKNYAGFLEYLEVNQIDIEYPFDSNKSVYLEKIDQFFPAANFLTTLNSVREDFLKRRELATKFNGELVMELTGLKGKELGEFIFNFKKIRPDWLQYLEDTPIFIIQSDILNFNKKSGI